MRPPVGAVRRLSPYLLAALLAAAGLNHFVQPEPYARIVPHALPAPRTLVYVSGILELACAVGLVVPHSRRRAGYATAVLFVAVFPANVQMALDGGLPGAGPVLGSAAVAWVRLPLQVPLILWAVHIARRADQGVRRPPPRAR